MSSITVLKAVSERLRGVLWEACRSDPLTSPIVTSEAEIVFTNPTETARNAANKLSLWLYQVTENEFVKNQPPERTNGKLAVQETPLALNLYYLATPFAPSEESNLLILGLTLRVLYDNAILPLQNPADGVFEELRIVLCRLSLEELTRIWEALREPYRLSVCYQVRVMRIDSQRISQRARVVEQQSDYGAVPDSLLEGRG